MLFTYDKYILLYYRSFNDCEYISIEDIIEFIIEIKYLFEVFYKRKENKNIRNEYSGRLCTNNIIIKVLIELYFSYTSNPIPCWNFKKFLQYGLHYYDIIHYISLISSCSFPYNNNRKLVQILLNLTCELIFSLLFQTFRYWRHIPNLA